MWRFVCVGMWSCVLGMTIPLAWGMGTEQEEGRASRVQHNVGHPGLMHPKPRRAAVVPPREWVRLLKTLERRGSTAAGDGEMNESARDLSGTGERPLPVSPPHLLERIAEAEFSQSPAKTRHNKRGAKQAHERTAQKNTPPLAVQHKQQKSKKERHVLPLSEFLRAGGEGPDFHAQNRAPLVKSALRR